ncbi:MAG: hypothetical protein DI548_06050 [Flavobacterium johnsoniae]|nr:MAG: hypothetical protein DI548_06050 [Flavobacterium johnsoniae]
MEDVKENNKKEIAEKREEREKEDKVSEDLKLVIDMAKIQCTLCTNPQGILKVNFDTPTTQDKLTATVVEKDMRSLIFMGTCTKSPNSAAPCASVMQLGEWKDVGTLKVQDKFPLLKKSTIPCNYGGSTIEITDSGQRSEPTQLPAGAPLPKKTDEEYKCTYCDDEITLEQIKYVITGETDGKLAEEENVKEILTLLNKYRKDYKLDTCLRKAHFIAQVGAESKFKNTTEGSSYSPDALSIFNSDKVRFRSGVLIDDTVLSSLSSKLTELFKIVDKDGKEIAKTNEQLKTILKDQKVVVDEKEIYARFAGVPDPADKKKKLPKLLKEVVKADKTVDYKIFLKIHSAFGMETLSRAYASRYENEDELSRDGWKFRGRGLKQITFKANYKSFTNFRNKYPFPDDTTGKIDFTVTEDAAKLTGTFDKLAANLLYGVQSALWYWIEGNGKVYANADSDNVIGATKAINGGYNGLENRDNYTKNARQESGLNVFNHYKQMHENGTETEKATVIKLLKFLVKDNKKADGIKKNGKTVIVNTKDTNAQPLLDELDKPVQKK